MKYFSVSQQWILFILALVLLGSLTFKFYYSPLSPPSGKPVNEVVVEVLGEVRRPGIYLYQDPPDLTRAIERAGGLKETAQFDATLSSTILETGTRLTVVKESPQIDQSPPRPCPLPPGEREKRDGPFLEEQHQTIKRDDIRIRVGRMAVNKLLVFSIPLDLNHMSVEDLCLVPGIGESLAREIVAYRKRQNGFRSVEELKNVRGIGEKNYQDLKGFFAAR